MVLIQRDTYLDRNGNYTYGSLRAAYYGSVRGTVRSSQYGSIGSNHASMRNPYYASYEEPSLPEKRHYKTVRRVTFSPEVYPIRNGPSGMIQDGEDREMASEGQNGNGLKKLIKSIICLPLWCCATSFRLSSWYANEVRIYFIIRFQFINIHINI